MGKHLTYEQRCQLEALQRIGLPQAAIATQVGVSQATVSRELRRNTGEASYLGRHAQAAAQARRTAASTIPRKLTPELVALIERKLRREQLSPQQISGWMARTQPAWVSHECIYRHIWANKQAGGRLFRQLRRSGKRYNKRANKLAGRGIIAGRVDISLRPEIVAARLRIGDWEADTMVGAARKGAILTLVERKSKYTLLHKLSTATAMLTAKTMIRKLAPHRARVLTITADNGKEFANHQQITENLTAGFYFATPYHAWERGLNENTNGLIRQYFPKGSDFKALTQSQVAKVQNLLNSRPRKTLGYMSPNEVFFGQ